ncbi:MAG TPA: M23 family metallopeptidase [Steroidobacteraceae bacterium]|nr:M23 family metallopeptidase [Steroidobacteraceae bacterium]
MNLIFFSRREGKARHLNLAHPLTLTLVGIAGLAVLAGVFATGVKVGLRGASLGELGGPAAISRERAELADLKVRLQQRIDGLAMKLGMLDAHMIRLNSLGKRLTQVANLSSREFDFDHDPAIGGPEAGGGRGAQIPDLSAMIDQFDRRLDFRTTQFSALEYVLLGRQLSAEIRPTGKPVLSGYISSYFGERMDPFNGEEAFHKGLDFASDAGTDVLAVAQGVVTWAGPREGYGVMVEVNHGNGYVTRYAHNSRVMVSAGDTVQRGQAIAVVGSTGRSTGPHVHFEVLKDGRQIDPMAYVGH